MNQQKFKICNSCGEKNNIDEVFCIECFQTDFILEEINIVENKNKQDKSIETNNELNTDIGELKFKICKSCGESNHIGENFCTECFQTDFLEDKINIELNKNNNLIQQNMNSKTLLEVKKKILFIICKNLKIEIKNGDILGREYIGRDFLDSTVSRKHIKFIFENNNWYIEDLNSTNGTFINNSRISIDEKVLINNNDLVNLSSKVSIKILLDS